MAKHKHWKSDPSPLLRVSQGFSLADFDPTSTPGFKGDEKDGAAALKRCGERLAELQERLYAQGRSGGTRSVLLVLQGMDTAGKGGISRHVLGMVDPQGLQLRSFGVPTDEERSHDFLWRIEKALPGVGKIGVFDRSHYEDVLVVRVHNLVPQEEWSPRYDQINDFEREVSERGISIVKCALMVSPEVQLGRLAERLEREDKFWKYNPGDLDERALWPAYMDAYQAVFDRTSTDIAPWHVIPADSKWYARLAVAHLLLDALEEMDLEWPAANFDLEAEKQRVATLRRT